MRARECLMVNVEIDLRTESVGVGSVTKCTSGMRALLQRRHGNIATMICNVYLQVGSPRRGRACA